MAPVTVRVDTFVPAPPEVVYAALLDPETHARTAPGRERVILPSPQVARPEEGPGDGGLDLDDEVTFEATHLGIRQRLTARITAVDPPWAFEDTQVRGFFRSMVHRHEFHADGTGTRMIDEMTFSSPLGALFDRFVLGPYLRRFLAKRGRALADLIGQR